VTIQRLILPLALLFSLPAQAVDPKTVFEVEDGNTVANALNCDWDQMNGTANVDTNTPAATACGVIGATRNAYGFLVGDSNEKVFRGGGSKDPIDIPSWRWAAASAPDKDTLTHGYAVSYTISGAKVLVFGGERFAVNGDANIGIWFFQKEVKPNSSGGFDGVHIDGDILAVSAFTNGGGHPELDVYKWDSTCTASHYATPAAVGACADTNLKLLFKGSAGGLCAGGPGCATVNGAPITPSWPYATKFGGGTTVPVNGFYEGGFDLTAIFPGTAPGCFSSFLLETRSSQEPSAVLKDFLAGSFPECHVAVSKNCACTSFKVDGPGYNYTAGGTVTNDGGGTIYNVEVVDNNITGKFTCGSMAAGVVKSWGNAPPASGGTCEGPAPTFFNLSNAVSNTATVTATSGPLLTSTAVPPGTDTKTCAFDGIAACIANPLLTVNKTCVTAIVDLGETVGIRVDYAGIVKNGGNVNLTDVTVTDTVPGNTAATQTFNIGTLVPNQEVCYTTNPLVAACPSLVPPVAGTPPIAGVASYLPNSITVPANGRASFKDTVKATGKNASLGTSVNSDPYDATCLVCPYGFCPTAP